MLTHDRMHRMGMQACGSVLDYNLSRMIVMIIEMTGRRQSTQVGGTGGGGSA